MFRNFHNQRLPHRQCGWVCIVATSPVALR